MAEGAKQEEIMAKKYQTIFLHLSDGRQLTATVPEFCKEGDRLSLHPQFEITAPREMPEGYSWSVLPKSPPAQPNKRCT